MAKMIFALVLAGSCLVVGYFYGTYKQARIWASINYLDSANRINSALKIIELAESGDVDEIVSAEESVLSMAALKLQDYPEHNSGVNKDIILNAIRNLKRFQEKRYGKPDPQVRRLVDALEEKGSN